MKAILVYYSYCYIFNPLCENIEKTTKHILIKSSLDTSNIDLYQIAKANTIR